MSETTSYRHGHRFQPARRLRARPALEVLEDRCLLSVNLVEVEPNNTRASANVMQRILDEQVIVSGQVNTLGDRDWFKIQLKQGDVFGAALKGKSGLNPTLRLVNSAGALMIANDDCLGQGATFLPQESPLPFGQSERDSEIYYVINTAGAYYLEVAASGDASAGKYDLDTLVARPGLEKQPVGTKQILFLDFDGADVNFSNFGDKTLLSGTKTLSPLVDSLPDWGLTAADENAVIDSILARVTDKLSTYVRANGLNGDVAKTGTPGQFDIEILNSRDHADQFGKNPFMSRIVVGAINDSDFTDTNNGLAQDVDPGNFITDDEAVATVDWIQGALDAFRIKPPATVIDAVGEGMATLAAHEAGHLFGSFHTDQLESNPFAGTPNVMDPGNIALLGPDFVFGTKDDVTLQLGVDNYYLDEVWRGLNDTLNTVSFGLSTGRGAAAESAGASSAVSTQTNSSSGGFATASLAAFQVGQILSQKLANEVWAGNLAALPWSFSAVSTQTGSGGFDSATLAAFRGGQIFSHKLAQEVWAGNLAALPWSFSGVGVGVIDNPNLFPGLRGLTHALGVSNRWGEGITSGASIILGGTEEGILHGRVILVSLFVDAMQFDVLGDALR